jgi:hypothetical protein
LSLKVTVYEGFEPVDPGAADAPLARPRVRTDDISASATTHLGTKYAVLPRLHVLLVIERLLGGC